VIDVSPTTNLLLQGTAAFIGAAIALLWFGLLVWTWRDVSARTKSPVARIAALVLVLLFTVIGLMAYLLLRPRETLSQRHERAMIEEILAREVTGTPLRPRPEPRQG
jgi:ABC-type molybdate transport system permease subunit